MGTNRTTQAQRDALLNMLQQDQWKEACGAAKIMGFDGITADLFEHIIARDGLHDGVIKAIAVYYDNDLKLREFIAAARKVQA